MDLYVAGYEAKEGVSVAKTWKNGVATALSDGTNQAFAIAIAVSGTDVYAAGEEVVGTSLVPKVWKNGAATGLQNPGAQSTVTSMCLFTH